MIFFFNVGMDISLSLMFVAIGLYQHIINTKKYMLVLGLPGQPGYVYVHEGSWHLCKGVFLQVMHGEVYIMETLHGSGGMDHQAPVANHESCNTADVSIARHSWGLTENTSALSDLI